MKKIKKTLVVVLALAIAGIPAAKADQASRIPAIMGRGLLNLVTSPLELIRTPVAESGVHPYLWPVTSLPRTFRNVFYRIGSAGYDIAGYPFVAPFIDETPPLTEKLGLSNYIWLNEDDY